MGFTRVRRYANYNGGKKYDKENNYTQLERGTGDEEQATAVAIFFKSWKDAEDNTQYAAMKKQWKNERG